MIVQLSFRGKMRVDTNIQLTVYDAPADQRLNSPIRLWSTLETTYVFARTTEWSMAKVRPNASNRPFLAAFRAEKYVEPLLHSELLDPLRFQSLALAHFQRRSLTALYAAQGSSSSLTENSSYPYPSNLLPSSKICLFETIGIGSSDRCGRVPRYWAFVPPMVAVQLLIRDEGQQNVSDKADKEIHVRCSYRPKTMGELGNFTCSRLRTARDSREKVKWAKFQECQGLQPRDDNSPLLISMYKVAWSLEGCLGRCLSSVEQVTIVGSGSASLFGQRLACDQP
ncbi:9000_t:CDS:2 [Acaulospora colombiana]|uniref:9000_t:CDS:1 n=1 Tax=Acaulospora colombiana TaxID=27376 RepID=A0ACA9NK61_9GLOM|nr:9000_t:CDS:2 [Acaulospora colombiana]